MRIEYHRTLIADKPRNDAFYAALKSVIVPGQTVVADIGAGTGLLGVFAAKLGAKSVYLFETAEVAGVAGKILKANRVKYCHLIPCHSTEFADRLSVDVIVSETLGNYALEENIVDTLNDARKRFLRPGGIVIPSAIRQFVVPVIGPRIDRELRAWQRVGYGVDLGVAETMSFNNVYVRWLEASELLDAGRGAIAWDAVDLTTPQRASRKGDARWTLKSDQTIYGFAVWWDATLHKDIVLSTAPGAPRTHWEQLYFPLAAPLIATAGDGIAVLIKTRSSEQAGTHLAWTAIHLNARGKELSRATHDLDKGYLP